MARIARPPRAPDSFAALPVIVVGQIPGAPPAFLPRSGLMQALDAPGPDPQAIVRELSGAPGTGKTCLAAACARARLADAWPLIAWINAGDAIGILGGLREVADSLGLRAAGDRRAGLAVRRFLEQHEDRCLIVFDGATDLDLVRPFIPARGRARVLITSDQEPATLGTTIPVGEFTMAEALTFLAETTGLDDEVGAREVADELGRLPLTLAHAAARITADRLDYPAYLERSHSALADERLAELPGAHYPPGLAAVLLMSLDAARAADETGACGLVMELLPVLSPAGVSSRLLCSSGGMVADALDRLARASLLNFSVDGATVTAHQLTMALFRQVQATTNSLASACRSAAACLDAEAGMLWRTWYRSGPAIRDLIGQISALQAAAHQCQDDDALAWAVIRLRWWTVTYLNQLGGSEEQAIAAARSLAADIERLFGTGHPDAIAARDNIGATYRAAGRADEAIGVHKRAVADFERFLGRDHPDALTAGNSLALAYRSAGRLMEAIEVHERTLAARERVLGTDHPDTLASRNNLALAYRSAGRIPEAITLHEQALAARQHVLGTAHPSTLASGNNLALAYRSAGRVMEAIEVHERTLAARERVLGTDHPDTLASRNNLALAYRAAGRDEEAATLRKQATASRGSRSPRVLTTSPEDLVIQLAARGRTPAEIAAHLAFVREMDVAERDVAATVDRVLDGMAEWQRRPLHPVYAVIFADAVVVKISGDRAVSRPVCLAVGVTPDCERDILGLWPSDHGDSADAAFWLPLLSGLSDRGVQEVRLVICGDRLRGLSAAVSAAWRHTSVQADVSQLAGGPAAYASRKDRNELADDLAWICTAASEAEALSRLARFRSRWEHRYPAVIQRCENAWPKIASFLRLDRELRTAICATRTMEVVIMRMWRAINARRHFDTEQAALRCLYLAITDMEQSWQGRLRWAARWSIALSRRGDEQADPTITGPVGRR